MAPFNRYQTLDVVRAVAESGRGDKIALYTGNDDNIVVDLLTTYDFGGKLVEIAGGLLGHWAVWTLTAVAQLRCIRELRAASAPVPGNYSLWPSRLPMQMRLSSTLPTAFTDVFRGIHGILRRQGLLAGRWCLDPHEELSPGQSEEIDRVCRVYPHLNDDAFVKENLDRWLA